MVRLTCKKIRYYAPHDEDAFFEWIKKIPSIKYFDGHGNKLYLYVDIQTLTKHDLWDIIALFYRYRISMRQLKKFLTPKNKEWFAKPQMFWYNTYLVMADLQKYKA